MTADTPPPWPTSLTVALMANALYGVREAPAATVRLSAEERLDAAVAALRPWACCVHCADDEQHDESLHNNHDIPCQTCVLALLADRAALAGEADRG